MRELALVTALRTIFGLEPGGDVHELGSLTVEFTEIISSPLTVLLPYAIPRTPYHEAQTLGARLMQEMLALITRKRASGATDDALSLLIHARDEQGGLSDDELLAETLTLFVAGHETTAKTLTWTCFLLERHPAVLHALLDELDGVLGGRSVCADDLPKLPLLERVVKESMRVLSPVPTVFLRVPSSPIALGHYMLPKGANVVISPLVTHHDARLYPSPRRFDPERWTTIKPTPFEYLPFGAGPRMCVGAAFAMQAVRLILATLLPRVRFQIQRDADISRLTRTNIFMPKYGIPARIERGHRRKLAVEPIRGDISQLVDLRS
jgi:cytochrome P450